MSLPYVLLTLFLAGLLTAGTAASRRVAVVGAWVCLLSGIGLAHLLLMNVAKVAR
ncbi:hypothetical protein [Streptomyces collinus]